MGGGVNMAEQKEATTAEMHHIPKQPVGNTITIRVPKPNMQIAVLGLVAFITLFQTFQLFRISGSTGATSVKAAQTTTTSVGGPSKTGSGSGASTPQSMVGGC